MHYLYEILKKNRYTMNWLIFSMSGDENSYQDLRLNCTNPKCPCDWGGIRSRRIKIISIGSDRVFVGFISAGFRPGFRQNSTKHDWNPTRSDPDFIGFHRIPTKSASESDKNSVGSDRFLMKNVGFRWNPMRIRSKTTGSAGRIDSRGYGEKTIFSTIFCESSFVTRTKQRSRIFTEASVHRRFSLLNDH